WLVFRNSVKVYQQKSKTSNTAIKILSSMPVVVTLLSTVCS
ncbi:ParA-like protein, partial [Methylomonas albis]